MPMLAEPSAQASESSKGETETVDVLQHFANASLHLQELAKLLRDIRAETPPVSSRSVHEAQGGLEAGPGPGPGGPALVPVLPIAKAAEPLELGETDSSFPTGLVSTSDSLTLSASPAGVDEEVAPLLSAEGNAERELAEGTPADSPTLHEADAEADVTLHPSALDSSEPGAGDAVAPSAPPEAILKEAPMEADSEEGCREEAAVTLPEGDAGASLAEVAPKAPSEVDSEPSSIDRLGDKEKQALAAAHQTLTEMAKLLLEAAVESPAASPRPEATDD
ncbi:dfa3 [Symbiodinium sp. CCMP2592]|nr:dfa3 [Symbiodinium sp. CCMP2592]